MKPSYGVLNKVCGGWSLISPVYQTLTEFIQENISAVIVVKTQSM